MKKLTILMLLFFINCSSQQVTIQKKYMDMETTFQKYRAIKTRYDSLVEKNKQNLVYEYGVYFTKSLYDKEAKERRVVPEKSNSTFVMEEGDRTYFVKNSSPTTFELYTLQDNKVIELANGMKDNNIFYRIDNFVEGTAVRYGLEGEIQSLAHYVQDKFDPNKRDVMLLQEFENNELLSEKNYKKDFKTTKEQMLKKLGDNFYNHAVRYLDPIDFRKEFSKENDVKKAVQESLLPLKKTIETAIENKNDFYKRIKIFKHYDEDNLPGMI